MIKLMYHYHPYLSKKMRELGIKPTDIQNLDDLKKMPITEKGDWIKEVKDFVLQPNEKTIIDTLGLGQKLLGLTNRAELRRRVQHEFFPVTFFSTSGRTSMPAPVFLTNYDLDLIQANTSRVASKLLEGIPKKICQNFFPHAPHLAYWQFYFSARGMPDVFSFSLGTGRTEYQVQLMEKFGTTVIAGIPTYIKYLSDIAREKRIKSSVKMILLGGEGVPEKMKQKIKDNFSQIGPEPKVITTYGLSETKIAFFECEEGSGYHLYPHLHTWEVIDPKSRERVGPEEGGMLVFSNTDLRGTVFLRYFPGDIAVKGITYEKCPHCGSTAPRIIGRIERVADSGILKSSAKIKGELVSFSALDELVSEVDGIKQYQVIIDRKDPCSPDRLLILVGFENGMKDKKAVKDNLVRKVKAFTNITPKVEEESAEKIFDNVMDFKGQRVKDKRKL